MDAFGIEGQVFKEVAERQIFKKTTDVGGELK
jgi:hypothetical protein